MTAEQFCYWLQGFMELNPTNRIDETQAKAIKEHLQTVFEKKTHEIQWPVTVPLVAPTPNMLDTVVIC